MMRKVRRFFALSPAERWRLVMALIVVSVIRAGLSVMSFPRFYSLFTRARTMITVKGDVVNRPSSTALARDVCTVSRYVPQATCLTQALAGQVFLERYGYQTTVHIGVTNVQGDSHAFQAHAWLESEGRVIIGGSEVPYVPLTTLSAERRVNIKP